MVPLTCYFVHPHRSRIQIKYQYYDICVICYRCGEQGIVTQPCRLNPRRVKLDCSYIKTVITTYFVTNRLFQDPEFKSEL